MFSALKSSCFVVVAICSLPLVAPAIEIEFGGIEIGSSSVKSVRLTYESEKQTEWTVANLKERKWTESGLVSSKFKSEVIDEVVSTTKGFLAELRGNGGKDFGPGRLFIVISSGAVAGAEKEKKLVELAKLQLKIENETSIKPIAITVKDEVRYTYEELTLLDGILRDSLVIDIGGGNTKFGTYVNGGQFASGGIPQGISSGLEDFKVNPGLAANALKTSASNELAAIRAQAGLGNFKPKTVYLLGGAFYSMMAYCQPGDLVAADGASANAPVFSDIRSDSFVQYEEWVKKGMFDAPDVSLLTEDHKMRALKSWEDSLKAVSELKRFRAFALIGAVRTAFELEAEGVRLRFPVDGNTAWLTGFVRERAEHDPQIAIIFLRRQYRRLEDVLNNNETQVTSRLSEIVEQLGKMGERLDTLLKTPINPGNPGNPVSAETIAKLVVEKIKLEDIRTLLQEVLKKIPTTAEIADKLKIDPDDLAAKIASKIPGVDVAKLAPLLAAALKIQPVDSDELAKKIVEKFKRPEGALADLARLIKLPAVDTDDLAEKIATDEWAKKIAKSIKIPVDDLAEKIATEEFVKKIAKELEIPAVDAAALAKLILKDLKVPVDIEELAKKIVADDLVKKIAKELKIDTAELATLILKDLKIQGLDAEKFVEKLLDNKAIKDLLAKYTPISIDDLAKKINDKSAEEIAKLLIEKLKIPTPKEIAAEIAAIKADELAKILLEKLKLPTSKEIGDELKKGSFTKDIALEVAKELKTASAKDIADELRKGDFAKDLALEVRKTVQFPTVKEIASAVEEKIPSAKDIANEIAEKVKFPTAREIAKEVAAPSARDIAKEVGAPSAREIAKEVGAPSAKEIAKEVAAPSAREIAREISIPSAKEIAREIAVPSANEIADKIRIPSSDEIAAKVRVPTAPEIAANVKVPTPAEIASLIRVPTAKEIAMELRLLGYGAPTSGSPSPVIWSTVYDACGCAFLVPKTIYNSVQQAPMDQNWSTMLNQLRSEIVMSEARLERRIQQNESSNHVALQSYEVSAEKVVELEEDMTPLELNPKSAWLAFKQGRDEYDRKNTKAALELFVEATRFDPKESLYWYFRSIAEVRLAKTKEAQASARRVAELLKNGASYTDLCLRLERVQGTERQVVQRYVNDGTVSLQKTPQLRSLTQ